MQFNLVEVGVINKRLKPAITKPLRYKSPPDFSINGSIIPKGAAPKGLYRDQRSWSKRQQSGQAPLLRLVLTQARLRQRASRMRMTTEWGKAKEKDPSNMTPVRGKGEGMDPFP